MVVEDLGGNGLEIFSLFYSLWVASGTDGLLNLVRYSLLDEVSCGKKGATSVAYYGLNVWPTID